MLNSTQLNRMSQMDICSIDPKILADISTVSIDAALPQTERIERYLKQVGNPYCFMSGDTPVRIRFANGEKPLTQSLIDYFSSLKQK